MKLWNKTLLASALCLTLFGCDDASKVDNKLDKAKDNAEQMKDAAADKAQAIKQDADKQIDTLKSQADAEADRLKDQASAIKTIKRTITDLDKSKIEEQKKAVRAGYDMDIIPSDLATYGAEAKKLLSDLQSRNQRMFLVTFLILNTADTKRQLDNNVFQTNSIAQKYNCNIRRLQYQQEQGLVASLPLGMNQTGIQRIMTTTSTAIFVPFTTQELFQGGEALYCQRWFAKQSV